MSLADWGLEADTDSWGQTFTAKYDGRCAGCREPYERGELVQYVEGEVQAVACCGGNPLGAPEKVDRSKLCPKCFCMKPKSGICCD